MKKETPNTINKIQNMDGNKIYLHLSMIEHGLSGVGVLNHEVSLLELSLLEERIGLELKHDLEANTSDHDLVLVLVLITEAGELLGGDLGARKLLAPDVDKVAESLLISLVESGDLTDSVVVEENVVPEIGDTGSLGLGGLLALLGLVASALLLGGLSLARGDLGATVVERGVEVVVLLEKSLELLLELALELRVLLVKTLESVETKVHLGSELVKMLLLLSKEGSLHVAEVDVLAVAIVTAAVVVLGRHFCY